MNQPKSTDFYFNPNPNLIQNLTPTLVLTLTLYDVDMYYIELPSINACRFHIYTYTQSYVVGRFGSRELNDRIRAIK